jgi:hypothetical protein
MRAGSRPAEHSFPLLVRLANAGRTSKSEISRKVDSRLHFYRIIYRAISLRCATNRLLPILAITGLTGSLLLADSTSAQFVSSAKKAAHVHILKGPELESATESLTIIRWTSDNPAGSPEHFGVVHYGTDPKNLSQTAKSHIRPNPTHSYPDFRVRIEGLAPKTTYYYKMDSMGAEGTTDGVDSPVKTLTTP